MTAMDKDFSLKPSFEDFRKRLQGATSKEELELQINKLLKTFPNRYKPLQEYLNEGNEDIKERLEYLTSEVEGDFLDVGSYDGFFVFELERKGKRAVGTDMMDMAIDYSVGQLKLHPDSHAEFHKAYAEALPFENAIFQTVILSHTLEHVFDPAKAISEAARVAKDNGKIIAIVPPELGNEPTHLRVVAPEWLANELGKYGQVSTPRTVGDGIAIVCKKGL
ncbi:MAG: class I SAM-dependent methyltransferase [Patescibacteria group bacterium]